MNISTYQAAYSTIAGGRCNYIGEPYVSIGGGQKNQGLRANSTIAGGYCNFNQGSSGAIGGGICNCITLYGGTSVIGGGTCNTACASSVIGGGANNTTSGTYSSIIGGGFACATRFGQRSFAAGPWIGTTNAGASQQIDLIGRNKTTSATPINIFLNGQSTIINIINGTAIWMQLMQCVCCVNADTCLQENLQTE